MRRFQDELWRALTLYAFIPLILLALLGTGLTLYTWQRDVVTRSQTICQNAADVVGQLVTEYRVRTNSLAENVDFTNLAKDKGALQGLYERLYHEVNITHINSSFYVLDGDANIIMSNRDTLPDYLAGLSMGLGFWQRMQNNVGQPVVEFSPRSGSNNCDVLIGRAAWQGGQLTGYVFFVIPAEHIAERIESPYTGLALVNSFDYAPVVTHHNMRENSFQKLAEPFRDRAREIIHIDDENEDYYVTVADVPQTPFQVYSAMPVTEIKESYQQTALAVLVALLIIVPLLLRWGRLISEERSREADELLEAFEALKEGQMDRKLVLRGEDFAAVAEGYNRMVDSLQELMRLNEEKAKASAVSEVRQLEAQFQPHFLFNTLENIKFMVKLDPDVAMKMVVALSSLLRYSINNLTQEVTLAEDLAHIRVYLEILKYRFGRRLQCEQDIKADTEHLRVPRLLVQPILENAVKYGEDEDGVIRLHLAVWEQNKELHATISNGGSGMAPDRLQEIQAILRDEQNPTNHQGIFNVHRRLQLIYGTNHGLTISCPATGGTRVDVVLPLIKV